MRSLIYGSIALIALAALSCGIPAQAQGHWAGPHAKRFYDSAAAACDAELRATMKQPPGASVTLSSADVAVTPPYAMAVCNFVGVYGSGPTRFALYVFDQCQGQPRASGFCSASRPSRFITVAITGTVASGRDIAGIFGRPGADLAGKSFTVIYTFDDKKGIQQIPDCAKAPGCFSQIESLDASSFLGPSSPGTGVVRIDGRASPVIGGTIDGSAVSSAHKTTYPCCKMPMTYMMSFEVRDSNGSAELSILNTTSSPPATRDADWRAAFSDSRIANMPPPREGPASNIFSIVKDRVTQASGVLVPATICVSEQRDGCAPTVPR